MTQNQLWQKDADLSGFQMRPLHFSDDYDGKVLATLVKSNANPNTSQAILYIHGYMDYFFQPHLADAFIQNAYDFYSLDLRKYGRSLQDAKHPNFCFDLEEYFSEISEAIRIICEEENHRNLILMAHSTGGLTSSLYASQGDYRKYIKGLILNSPFFDFNLPAVEKFGVGVLAQLATAFPFLSIQNKDPDPYMMSIHQSFHGEWDFSLEWRKPEGFPIYAGWLRAIQNAHQRLRQGLNIASPVLVMYADKSIYGKKYTPEFQTGDAVLDVKHIRDGCQYLGTNIQQVEIKDGLHDLILSRQDVRDEVFKHIFLWLKQI